MIQTLQTIADSQGLSFQNRNFKFKKGKATPIKAETPAVGEMLALKKRDAKGIEKAGGTIGDQVGSPVAAPPTPYQMFVDHKAAHPEYYQQHQPKPLPVGVQELGTSKPTSKLKVNLPKRDPAIFDPIRPGMPFAEE